VYTGLWWGSVRKGVGLEDLGLGGRMTLKWIFMSGMDWIDLAKDRAGWRVLVNAIMNLGVP